MNATEKVTTQTFMLKYRLTTLSPVIVAHNDGDVNMVSTRQYIPGSALLGAFAWRYIRDRKGLSGSGEKAHLDEFFYSSFLNDGITFTNAYIAKKCTEIGKEKAFFPAPGSLVYKKESPDKIINLLMSKKELDPVDSVKDLGGYFVQEDDIVYSASPSRRVNFHHGRDRVKGSSGEGLIFNYESIEPGQHFIGFLKGSKDDLESLRKMNAKTFNLRLGRSKHTQYGKIKFEFLTDTPEPFLGEVENSPVISSVNPADFTILLLSPAIIYNDFGFPEPSINCLRQEISQKLELSSGEITINEKDIYSGIDDIITYCSVWNLPAPSEKALSAGTIFKVSINASRHENIRESLDKMVLTGIGVRNGEGYGRIALDIPAGKYTFDKKIPDVEEVINKPGDKMPDEVRKVLDEIVQGKFLAAVRSEAIVDCSSFTRLPSGSLLNRLISIHRTGGKNGKLKEEIKKMRKTAEESLDKCRGEIYGKGTTLLNHLLEYEVDPDKILKQVSSRDAKLESFYKTFTVPRERLNYEYLLTFMSFMVKRGGEIDG